MSEHQGDVNPTQAKERIEFVDILRGLAILFILVENMAAFSGQSTPLQELSQPLDRLVRILIVFFLEAKSYSILSLLFGWGIAVQMERVERQGGRFVPFFLRRLFVLFVFGLLHRTLIWFGDVLVVYALFGLFLLLWRKRSPRVLLIAAVAFLALTVALNIPGEAMDAFRQWYWNVTAFIRRDYHAEGLNALGTYGEVTRWRIASAFASLWPALYYFGSMFGMFLLGAYIARRRIFRDIEQHLPLVRRVMWIGLALGLFANWSYVETFLSTAWIAPRYLRLFQVGTRTVGAASFVLLYVAAVILLTRRERAYRRLAPLAAVGRMSLSNYLFQSVVCTMIFYGYGLGLYGEVGPAFGMLLTGIIYATQVRLSHWWLDGHAFGPVEWLWRTMTYGRRLPLRVGAVRDVRPVPLTRRLRQAVARVDRRLLWVGLAVGALCVGGVALWRVRQQKVQVIFQTKEVVVRVTPRPAVASVEPTFAVATPVVQPATYSPGPIAATGDLLALASAFDAQMALAEIETLTGPPYLGRCPGTPGGWAAGDFIAKRFAEYGLQPAGSDGTFFQAFPVEFAALAREPVLVVVGPDGTVYDDYVPYRDFSAMARRYAGAGAASGGVVWANNCAPGDFDALDVVGKVVLCRGYPPVEVQRNALEHGAEGLLLLTDEAQRPPDFGEVYGEAWVPEPLPSLRAFPSVVDEILLGSGLSVLDLSSSFTSFPLHTEVRMQVETVGAEACPSSGCLGRNVLGVLPGRDPEHASEVVVLGAHYDHLGESPGGTAWVGANDNASGVAVLLEIARLWHEQGYVPRRTVLFAAWDAEERGLIGAQHYVARPSYPLTRTVAMLQLDMVGAGGDVLSVDGGPELGQRLGAVADALDVENEPSAEGRSDHVPFWRAGIPANLLIWSSGSVETPQYHRPVDTVETIETGKLETVGKIAGITVLALAEGELDIVDMLQARAAAIERGDLEAFLVTSAAEQQAGDRTWFDDLQLLAPSSVTLRARDVYVSGRDATASVQIEVAYPVEGEERDRILDAVLPVQFTFEQGGWRWGGPDLEEVEAEDGFVVRYPPGRDEAVAGLGQRAAERYADLAALLGLPERAHATLTLLPSGEALRASTALSRRFDDDSWVAPGVVKLVYSEGISTSVRLDDALARLVLAEAGVTEDAAPWLWRGLPLVLRASMGQDSPRYLGDVQAALASEQVGWSDATAWAAVEYLRQQVGWTGLGQFIADLGRACGAGQCSGVAGLDEALDTSLQMDAAAFEVAWQMYWRDRLAGVQADLDTALAARAEVVLAGDEAAFLEAVEGRVPNLVAEERYWFADLSVHRLEAFSLSGKPLALLDDGSILASVTMAYQVAGEPAQDEIASLAIRFTPGEGGYRWAGVPFEVLAGERVQVLYASAQAEQAPAFLDSAETVYALLAERLDVERPAPLVVKLYPDDETFRTSISPSFPGSGWARGWTADGTSVKLQIVGDAPAEEYLSTLAVQSTRYLLHQLGVDAEWLLRGCSLYFAHEVDGGAAERAAAGALGLVLKGVEDRALYDLDALPQGHELSGDNLRIVNAQAWDTIRYLTYTYGDEALFDLLRLQGSGQEVGVALQGAIGQSLPEFTATWGASLASAHALPAWVDTAKAFDPEWTKHHVDYMADAALAGRQAGSPGAAAAAAYIADWFAEHGLVPIDSAAVVGYEQRFPISYTQLLEAPQIEFVDADGQVLQALVYRQDFVALLHESPGRGNVEGELVWVRDLEYGGIELGGKIAVRIPSSPVDREVAQAMEHGAGGLLLVGKTAGQKRPLAKYALPVSFPVTETIPVLELTQPGYELLLELAGETKTSVLDAPPALPLGVYARLIVPLAAPQVTETANILGLLPGSDPHLKDEVVLLSAHYDHVGDDPVAWACPPGVSAIGEGREAPAPACQRVAGLRYPGTNDNASGVGVLLEIARLWHESGYRPRRSVLFVAWGAQEAGQAGLAYYFEDPLWPVEDVVAALHLEAVGGGGGYYLGAQGTREQEGLLRFAMQAAEDALEGRLTLSSPPRQGDPAALFRRAGIPTLWLTWREASEENWPAELEDEVQPYRLGVTGRMVTLAAMCLAR